MPRTVELRSDTFTLPTASMRAAMAAAEVGDDVWDEDPTIHRLQQRAAEMVGKPASLFFCLWLVSAGVGTCFRWSCRPAAKKESRLHSSPFSSTSIESIKVHQTPVALISKA